MFSIVFQHYLVLPSALREDGYSDLRQCLRDVMTWADPSIHYTHVAVTKNFRGSPHTDQHDTTFQVRSVCTVQGVRRESPCTRTCSVRVVNANLYVNHGLSLETVSCGLQLLLLLRLLLLLL